MSRRSDAGCAVASLALSALFVWVWERPRRYWTRTLERKQHTDCQADFRKNGEHQEAAMASPNWPARIPPRAFHWASRTSTACTRSTRARQTQSTSPPASTVPPASEPRPPRHGNDPRPAGRSGGDEQNVATYLGQPGCIRDAAKSRPPDNRLQISKRPAPCRPPV
jgi:hypothetical protein